MRRPLVLLAALGALLWASAAPAATVNGDFNGDGFADLAIGVPNESVGSSTSAGAVNILYGSATGLTSTADQRLHQDILDVNGSVASDERFGRALAAADFDGDGFSDLAVGIPGEDAGSFVDAGAVQVFYGSAEGLSGARDRIWHQGSAAVAGSPRTFDDFGQELAAGDFGRSGRADLAIGVPGERVGGHPSAGAVNVLYGSRDGITAAGDQRWHQDARGIRERAQEDDRFGASLAAGNLGRGSEADLVVGAAREDLSSAPGAGAVNVIYGGGSGLAAGGNQVWHQNRPGVLDAAEAFDTFGWAIAVGDFGGSRHGDLAIGVPDETLGAIESAGAVNVLYGTANGLSAADDQLWTQDSTDVEDDAEARDFFGSALGAANFGQGSRADLAVSALEETIGAATQAGAVNVLYGGADGLSATGDQFWHQDSTDVEDSAETGDYLGESFAAGDFGNGSQADLAIGAAFEDLDLLIEAGAVNVLYGTMTGLSATGDQFWHQDVAGVEDLAETDDQFGSSLAPGR